MAKDVNIWQNIVEVDDRHWQLAKDSFMPPPLLASHKYFFCFQNYVPFLRIPDQMQNILPITVTPPRALTIRHSAGMYGDIDIFTY